MDVRGIFKHDTFNMRPGDTTNALILAHGSRESQYRPAMVYNYMFMGGWMCVCVAVVGATVSNAQGTWGT